MTLGVCSLGALLIVTVWFFSVPLPRRNPCEHWPSGIKILHAHPLQEFAYPLQKLEQGSKKATDTL